MNEMLMEIFRVIQLISETCERQPDAQNKNHTQKNDRKLNDEW